MRRISLIAILLVILFQYPVHLFASNLLYSEDFDDQNIDQPSAGTLSIYYGIASPAQLNTHYEIVSPGRDGSGYSFRSKSGTGHDSHGFWNYSNTWPSDEYYVSMWIRMVNVENPIAFDNLKLFYPHWDGTKSYVHYGINANGQSLYYSTHDKNGAVLEQSVYITGVSPADGNWHKYEWWVKFSTGQHRFWYDGTLKLDKNYTDGCWTNNMYHLKFAGYDSGTQDTFQWQVDDFEVWDGMPSSDQGSQDNYPSITIASPTADQYYTASSDTLELGGSASDDVALSQVTWSNSLGGQGTVSGSLGSWNISGISLIEGENVITVTATDTNNQSSSDIITVSYLPNAETPSWSAINQAGNSTWSDSGATWCVRLLVEGSSILDASDGIKLAFQGRNSGNYTIRKVSIAEKDPNGYDGDVINSTWVRVTFDGNDMANWDTDVTTVPAGVEKVSDPLSFPIDPAKDYYVTYTLESPAAYLIAPSYYSEMYFEDADHASDLDWSGISYKTYDARLHALSSIYPAEGGGDLLAIPGMPSQPQILLD